MIALPEERRPAVLGRSLLQVAVTDTEAVVVRDGAEQPARRLQRGSSGRTSAGEDVLADLGRQVVAERAREGRRIREPRRAVEDVEQREHAIARDAVDCVTAVVRKELQIRRICDLVAADVHQHDRGQRTDDRSRSGVVDSVRTTRTVAAELDHFADRRVVVLLRREIRLEYHQHAVHPAFWRGRQLRVTVAGRRTPAPGFRNSAELLVVHEADFNARARQVDTGVRQRVEKWHRGQSALVFEVVEYRDLAVVEDEEED